MDKRFAMVKDGIVTNIVMAEASSILELMLPEFTIVEETEQTLTAWIGAEFIENRFKPQQPYETWVWDGYAFEWTPPVPYPNDGSTYVWVDESAQWVPLSEIELEPEPEPEA